MCSIAGFSGRVDGSHTLFTLACIELWRQRFLDRRPELAC